MDRWEVEDFEPAPKGLLTKKLNNLWDDEDHESIKDSREDEDEVPLEAPKREENLEITAPNPGPKGAWKNDKQPETKKSELANKVPADPVAEKLRQQRLAEGADYKSTTELFGKKDDGNTLENLEIEKDDLEYAKLLPQKMRLNILISWCNLAGAGAKKKQLRMDRAIDDYSVTERYNNLDDYDII